MPFYQDYSNDHSTVLCWKYGEGDDFQERQLIDIEEQEKFNAYHPKKRLEYLMVREMLSQTLPQHQIKYESTGAPYLFPKSAHLSISHSFPFAAIAIAKDRVGIDLEKISERILNIKHKFLFETEVSWTEGKENEKELLTIIWAIKESLYKLHPSKYWSLKKHYEVTKFDINDISNIECRVFDDNFCDVFTASVIRIEDYYFAVIDGNN